MESTDYFYFKKLRVYHLAKQLVADVYAMTEQFPAQEKHGLVNQIQRAAVSIPSNIAEGVGRFSVKDRVRFVEIAYGSLMEVVSQLDVTETLGYISGEQHCTLESTAVNIAKMVFNLKRSLEKKVEAGEQRVDSSCKTILSPPSTLHSPQ